MHKNESAENYLEAILMLSKEQLEVRSIDVSGKVERSRWDRMVTLP